MAFSIGCGGAAPALDSAPPNPDPHTVTTPGGMRMHIVQTGWGATKRNAYDVGGPVVWRLLRIVTGSQWTGWFPVQFYVIEHPEGVLVYDTGETARIFEEGYYRCDATTEWIYRNLFRFTVAPEYELGPQLERLGIDPAGVKWAVLSHLHADHMGGMRYLTGAEFLISRRDWAGHDGALLCRIPEWVEPTLVDYAGEPFGAFEASRVVGGDPMLRIVPTPGHSPGHQSLLLREGDAWTLFAGDSIVDLEAAGHPRDTGFAEEIDAAYRTHETIRRQLRDFDTVLAPAHDRHMRDGTRFPSHVH